MKRVAAALLACAAACSLYGSDDPDETAPAAVADSGADGSLDDLDGGDAGTVSLENVGNDGAIASDGSAHDATADQRAPLGDLYVFITSTKITGKIDFGTPEAAADKICNDLALGQPHLNGRKFAAWIGITSSPVDRIMKKAVGYRYLLVNGEIVTTDPVNIASAGVAHAITRNEEGITVSLVDHVWTGVAKDGKTSSSSCTFWGAEDIGSLGLVGDLTSGETWTSYTVDRCDTHNHLYCFEVP